MSVNFRSDNETPVAAPIMDAILAANQGSATAYAEDGWSEQLDQVFSDLFQTDATVLPVVTGTVANSIALATVTPSWGSVYCHQNAHILNDEGGAPEFYGSGLRLVPVAGDEGKMTLNGLKATIRSTEGHGIHSYLPSTLSLTQATECGTLYSANEIQSLCNHAHSLNMSTHMDGARFANAIASLDCQPADITSKAGVDMLSFGASKNGCMAAEALVIFNHPEWREKAERIRKRGGHLLSKMRYVSAQLLAYLQDDHWLQWAGHANQQAAKVARMIEKHPAARLEYPVQANEVFVRWSDEGLTHLESKGIQFHRWPGHNDLARLVFAHSTRDADVQTLIDAM